MVGWFLGVTLPYQLGDAKVGTEAIAGLLAAVAVAMGLVAPCTEFVFIVATCANAFIVGLTHADFSGVVLEAIGRGAAATKYSLLASLSNMPIACMTVVNGWSHERWGTAVKLDAEAAACVVAVAVFMGVPRLGRPRATAVVASTA